MKINVPIGTRFGKLVVTAEAPVRGIRRIRQMACHCDCGGTSTADLSALRHGNTTSCGCGSREALVKSRFKHGHTVGGRKPPEYHIWRAMIQRCENVNCADYPDYGGRGIEVCSRWRTSFADFLADIGLRPGKGLTLDRRNNDGDYEPNNCRWATQKQQANNRRKRRFRKRSDIVGSANF